MGISETWHLSLMSIECSIVVFLNAMLVLIIFSHRKLRSRLCNLFLVNLFAAHIVEGLVGILRSSVLYSIPKDPVKVRISVNLFTIAVIHSYLTYIPVTLDRYIAINYPFRYQQITCHHVALINGSVWFFSVLFGVVVFSVGIQSKVGDGITFAATLLMYALCVGANASIYRVVKTQVKKMKRIPTVAMTTTVTPPVTTLRKITVDFRASDIQDANIDSSATAATRMKREPPDFKVDKGFIKSNQLQVDVEFFKIYNCY